jgi:ketosteroid isomerase-like protein
MRSESSNAANPEWVAFMVEFEAAEVELAQGRPAAFKALWSQSPDVSIYGAFGGTASGWEAVATRLDWVGRQFSEGTRSREEIGCTVTDKLAYLAQTERILYRIPGHAEETILELRATLVFRREADGWRIVHRHADPLMHTQAPK